MNVKKLNFIKIIVIYNQYRRTIDYVIKSKTNFIKNIYNFGTIFIIYSNLSLGLKGEHNHETFNILQSTIRQSYWQLTYCFRKTQDGCVGPGLAIGLVAGCTREQSASNGSGIKKMRIEMVVITTLTCT